MALPSSNRVALRRIVEATYGTTPASPAFDAMRFTSESVNYNLSNIVSDEIRADRMIPDLVQVASDASGDVNFEMSYNAYDLEIRGAMANAWNSAVNITAANDIAIVAGDFSTTTTDLVAAGIVVGQWIRASGYVNTENNGYHRVTAVSANSMSVNTTLVNETAPASVDIVGTMIRNGTDQIGITFQKELTDLASPIFFTFNGGMVNTMALNVATGQILTGTFNMMALGGVVDTTGVSGQSENPATTADVMNAVDNVVNIQFDDAVATAYFSELSLTINNNLRGQDAVGSLPHIDIALSRLEVTGSISLYIQDETLYDKYLNATAFSLSFRVQDDAGNAYVVTLPRVKFETGTANAPGLDQDVFQVSDWRALRDPTTDCMVQIDKFAA